MSRPEPPTESRAGTNLAPGKLTTPSRHRDRFHDDRAAAYAVIDEAVWCHVGYVVDGRPVVLPQLHARVGDDLILHASTGAGLPRGSVGGDIDVCVTITMVDGLVLARSAFNHSINYRSVVVRGHAEVVTDPEEKGELLQALVNAVVPGRPDHIRGPSRKELAATAVLRLPIEQASFKVRAGDPIDEPEDVDLPYWAGVLPLRDAVPGTPVAAPDVPPGEPVPAHVNDWRRPRAASPGQA